MEKQTRNEATNTLIIQLNEMYHEAKAQDTPIGTYASISLNNESIFLVVSQTGHYYGSYVVDTDVVFTTSADSPRELTESLFDFREGYGSYDCFIAKDDDKIIGIKIDYFYHDYEDYEEE